ncbi:hypothetical protein pEaSNUABM11_00131 [Erwinia phage pEa_SNUABM_11]|nr:hypothetical protein pEaSNUABM11_00131 [Erwinia phage pEa_SNUABM_11]
MSTLDFVKKGMPVEELVKQPRVVEHPELPVIMMAGQRLHLLSDTVSNLHFIVASADGHITRVFNRVKKVGEVVSLTPFRNIIRDERGMYFFKVLANKPKLIEALRNQDQRAVVAISPMFFGLSRAYAEAGQNRVTGMDSREQWSDPRWAGNLRGEVGGKPIAFFREVRYSLRNNVTRCGYLFTRTDGYELQLSNSSDGIVWEKASDFLKREDISNILSSFI